MIRQSNNIYCHPLNQLKIVNINADDVILMTQHYNHDEDYDERKINLNHMELSERVILFCIEFFCLFLYSQTNMNFGRIIYWIIASNEKIKSIKLLY